jgi:hypothetical protein
MSMAAQLSIDIGTMRPKKRKATEFTCRCGHVDEQHANRRHTGRCTVCGEECRRFKPKKKPPVEQPAHLAAPNGAILLERDDTKKAKSMGWAIVKPRGPDGVEAFNGVCEATGLHAIIYLAQLKTKSLNKPFFGGKEPPTGAMWRRMYAWQGKYKDDCRERTASAIAQLGTDVALRGRPSAIVVTRVSPGTLDKHDNLRGALKYLVDGIAEALGFNDAELEDSPSRAGTIHIRYAQEKCPQKVCGVRIEITWRTA